MTDAPRPPDVKYGVIFACAPGGRGERVETARCTVCGWWGHVPDPGETLDLFGEGDHTEQECHRRQLDPRYRREQDNARLIAAGLPGLASPLDDEADTRAPHEAEIVKYQARRHD